MSLDAGLVTWLGTVSAITDLTSTRIYAREVPQNHSPANPALVYHLVAQTDHYSHDGRSNLTGSRVQIDCLAGTPAGVVALANAVRQAMSGYKGSMGSVPVRGVFLDSAQDFEDSQRDSAGSHVRRRVLDFFIWHGDE